MGIGALSATVPLHSQVHNSQMWWAQQLMNQKVSHNITLTHCHLSHRQQRSYKALNHNLRTRDNWRGAAKKHWTILQHRDHRKLLIWEVEKAWDMWTISLRQWRWQEWLKKWKYMGIGITMNRTTRVRWGQLKKLLIREERKDTVVSYLSIMVEQFTVFYS